MNWVMQILQLLLNGQDLKGRSQAFTEQWLNSLRQIITLLVVTIVGLVLFCVSVTFSLKELLPMLDSSSFHWSAVLVGHISLLVASLVAMGYGLGKARWLKAIGREERKSETSKASPIEDALAMVIVDFVKEREFQRENAKKL